MVARYIVDDVDDVNQYSNPPLRAYQLRLRE